METLDIPTETQEYFRSPKTSTRRNWDDDETDAEMLSSKNRSDREILILDEFQNSSEGELQIIEAPAPDDNALIDSLQIHINESEFENLDDLDIHGPSTSDDRLEDRRLASQNESDNDPGEIGQRFDPNSPQQSSNEGDRESQEGDLEFERVDSDQNNDPMVQEEDPEVQEEDQEVQEDVLEDPEPDQLPGLMPPGEMPPLDPELAAEIVASLERMRVRRAQFQQEVDDLRVRSQNGDHIARVDLHTVLING